jgi:hypothetical protein
VLDPALFCALNALTADYWRRVDRLSSEAVADLYVEAGLMRIGTLHREGRSSIAAFFQDRNTTEVAARRTTRHLASPLHIETLGRGRARIHSTVQVISGLGDWPVASAPPSTVGDFVDVVVKTHEDRWLFESRTASIVFTGAGAASFAR